MWPPRAASGRAAPAGATRRHGPEPARPLTGHGHATATPGAPQAVFGAVAARRFGRSYGQRRGSEPAGRGRSGPTPAFGAAPGGVRASAARRDRAPRPARASGAGPAAHRPRATSARRRPAALRSADTHRSCCARPRCRCPSRNRGSERTAPLNPPLESEMDPDGMARRGGRHRANPPIAGGTCGSAAARPPPSGRRAATSGPAGYGRASRARAGRWVRRRSVVWRVRRASVV
jgi:hypothetical protein